MTVVRSCRAEECYEDTEALRTIALQMRDNSGFDSIVFVDVPLCRHHNGALDNDVIGAHPMPAE